MAHIVDKKENLRRFINAMNNSSSIFTRSKNFGKSSKDISTSSTPSTAPSPTFSPTAMDPIEGAPGSPLPLYPSQDFEDSSRNMLSSRDMNQPPKTPPSKEHRTKADLFNQWPATESSFSAQQNQDDRSLYPDSLVNKLLTSPQLTGTRAPPPTPETGPHFATENNEDIEEIVGNQINKHFANKTNAVGLGESIHAPHRSSPLTGGWARSRFIKDENGNTHAATSDRDMSAETRRLRDLSFERASFKAADSPSASGTFTKAADTAKKAVNYLATASGTHGADTANSVPSKKVNDWVPPHLRMGEPSPDPFKPTTAEPKPQRNDGNSASALVKKMEAGTKSFLAKWGGQRQKYPDVTPTTWEEPVVPESRYEHFKTPASSAASSTDEEETRVVYTPAELVAVKSEVIKEQQATSTADLTPAKVRNSLEVEVNNESQPSISAEAVTTKPDVSFLPPHLRFGPSSSSNIAPKSKAALRDDAVLDKPSLTQPPAAASEPSTSKVTVPSVNNQTLKKSSIGPRAESHSVTGVRPVSTSSASYIAAAKAVAAAAEALGKDGALFFKSYPEPESRGRPVARKRKVIISHLPPRCTAKFIASLIYGGPIESIVMKPGSAEVLFVDAQHCAQFCSGHENGLDYGKEEKIDYVLVDMNSEVDVVSGKLQEMIDNGVTRCVRVIGVDHEWTKERLWDLAEKRNSRLEHLEDKMGEGGKIRTVTFRFCKMDDANTFKAMLVRDEDWEHCNIRFAPDPCETAEGVHFDD